MQTPHLNRILSNEEIQRYAPSAFAGQPYHNRSDRYAFVPTSAVIDAMRQNGFQPVSARQSGTRIPGKENFTRHMLRFRQEDAQVSKVGDSVLEAVLINSHDGTSLYDLSCGLFRLACLNGLMVSEGTCQGVKVKHTGNILEQVIEETYRIMEQAPKLNEIVRRWQAIPLDHSEQVILAETAKELREYPENVAAAIPAERLLTPRRYSDNGTDLWSTFNRIQENVVKGKLSTRVNGVKLSTRAVRSIDGDVKLNRALWTMAEKFATLKA
jgi:hypothetical protein